MANRVRPRCPKCEAAMRPVYYQPPGRKMFIRLRDSFTCLTHGGLAVGRRKLKFLRHTARRCKSCGAEALALYRPLRKKFLRLPGLYAPPAMLH